MNECHAFKSETEFDNPLGFDKVQVIGEIKQVISAQLEERTDIFHTHCKIAQTSHIQYTLHMIHA